MITAPPQNENTQKHARKLTHSSLGRASFRHQSEKRRYPQMGMIAAFLVEKQIISSGETIEIRRSENLGFSFIFLGPAALPGGEAADRCYRGSAQGRAICIIRV